jgi:thymidylate synthase/dihydrofolate reductase
MELIVAIDSNNGIGYKGEIPWNSREDLRYFREKTLDKTLLVGRKTVEKLPHLSRRNIICLSRNPTTNTREWLNKVILVPDMDSIREPVIVAGGAQVYKEALSKKGFLSRVYLTVIKGTYDCDTYFDMEWLKDFIIVEKVVSQDSGNEYLTLVHKKHTEHQYLALLREILDFGTMREGRNGITKSLFMNNFKFDLRDGFPLLTTKKMFFRGILAEFIFFLNGATDSTALSDAGVRIWEGNTTKEFIESRGLPYAEGVMGPMYGYQWRHFNAPYSLNDDGKPKDPVGGIDQLANVVNLIKADPHSRRILLTSYNPSQAEEGVLYPCHSIIIQFYVDGDFLDMSCYNRSQDVFLGVPYNIASSSLLLMIVSKLTQKTPRYLIMTMGDTHLYESHLPQAEIQSKRIPYRFPTLTIPDIKDLNDLKNLKTSDFTLLAYLHHRTIRAPMIA